MSEEEDHSQSCPFCMINKGIIPAKRVFEDDKFIAALELYPANDGHIVLFPKKHYALMPHMPQQEIGQMGVVTKKMSHALLMSAFGKATTVLVQSGGAAQQRVPHFSVNIIPRKKDDLLFKTEGKQGKEEELVAVQKLILERLKQVLGRSPVQEKTTQKPAQPKSVVVEEKKETTPVQEVVKSEPVIQEKVIIKEKECDHILNPPQKYTETKEKVAKIGVEKEEGYLYFVDQEGDISRALMQRRQKKETPLTQKVVQKAVVEKKDKKTTKKKGVKKQKEEEHKEEVETTIEYEEQEADEAEINEIVDYDKQNLLDDISRVILGR